MFKNMFYQALKHLYDIFLLYKTHFAVYLGKFRLTVGAQILVAETFGQLEIPVESTHHQQLLEYLRTLGQGIEFTRIHT